MPDQKPLAVLLDGFYAWVWALVKEAQLRHGQDEGAVTGRLDVQMDPEQEQKKDG